MTWSRWIQATYIVARRDMLALRRSRGLAVGVVLYSFAVVARLWTMTPRVTEEIPGYLVMFDPGGGFPQPSAIVVFGLGRTMPLFLGFVAVGYGAGAIAGHHQAGSIRTLQSLPFSRANVTIGTILARVAAVMTVVFAGLMVCVAVAVYRFGPIEPFPFAKFTAVTLLYAAVLTTFVVSVSAMVSTRLRAIAISLGPYLLALAVGTDRGLPFILRSALPVQPYQILVAGSHDQLLAVPRVEHAIVTGRIDGSIDGQASDAIEFAASAPPYMTDLGAVITLIGWLVVVPIAIFTYRRQDL